MSQVYIDRTDGQQTQLEGLERVHSHRGAIRLEIVPDALADPNGWIEYETTIATVSTEEIPEWVGDNETEEMSPGRCRVYARAVVSVLYVE